MKLKYRFLFPAVAAVALIMALFGALMIASSFTARLTSEREKLGERIQACTFAVESALANYALQGIHISDAIIETVARAQGDNVSIARVTSPSARVIWLDGRTLCVQSPLPMSGGDYALTLRADISELYAHREALTRVYRAFYLAAVSAVALIILWIAKRVTKPLDALTEASEKLADGKLDFRVTLDAKDEIGALAARFNQMADALTDQLARQTRLIEGLTHELKTPLAAMVGHADAIRSGRLDTTQMMLAAQTILHQGKRLDALSRAMTDWILYRRDVPARNKIRISLLFTDVREAFPGQDARFQPSVAADSEDLWIMGDRALLSSMVVNLVKNAQNAGATHAVLRAACTQEGAPVITVTDDGCGMDAETLARATEPFYRADKARSRENGGVGLGLTLASAIARLSNADLRLESAPGEGTTAIIAFDSAAICEETDAEKEEGEEEATHI